MSVLIRVSPETKDILDKLKADKKVKGKNYYKRNMKYDDLIHILLKYRYKSLALDHISSILAGGIMGRRNTYDPSINEIVKSFTAYLTKLEPTLSNKYSNDKEYCNKVLDILHNVEK